MKRNVNPVIQGNRQNIEHFIKNTVSDCDLDPYSFTKKEPSLSTSS